MSRWITAAQNELYLQSTIIDQKRALSHFCSSIAFLPEPFEPYQRSISTLLFRGDGHLAPKLHHALSENHSRNAMKCTNEGTILAISRVMAWIATFTQIFTKNDIYLWHHQNLYADHKMNNLLDKINPLLGTIKCFAYFQNSGELDIMWEYLILGESKCTILNMYPKAICFVILHFVDRTSIAVRDDWSRAFVCWKVSVV